MFLKKKVKGKGRKTVLSIGIAILFVLFVGYAIETVYPGPDYENYCRDSYKPVMINDEQTCIAQEGVWTNNTVQEIADPVTGIKTTGWCDLYFKCNEDFNKARVEYDRNLFFITLVIGIITFVIAVFLLVEAVSTGFMGGGLLTILYGTLRNWGSLSNVWRTLMLGFALAVLVWIGYKKLER